MNDDDEDEYEPRSRSRSSGNGGGGGIGGDKGAIGASSAYDSHDDAVQATKCATIWVQGLGCRIAEPLKLDRAL